MRDRAAVPAALREPIARAVAYSADRQIYDDLLRLAREQDNEQERMLYYNALAGARAAELIEQTVQVALRDPKLPPAQILPFLEQAAKESGDPDRVWRLVFAHRNEILGRLSGLQRQQALSRIARASANPSGRTRIEVGGSDACRPRNAPICRRGGRGDRVEGRSQDDARSGGAAVDRRPAPTLNHKATNLERVQVPSNAPISQKMAPLIDRQRAGGLSRCPKSTGRHRGKAIMLAPNARPQVRNEERPL